MTLKRCLVTVSDVKLAAALGQPPHRNQVTVGGAYPSKAAFARALRKAGLVGSTESESSVLRQITDFGNVSLINEYTSKEIVDHPETLMVQPLDARDEPFRPISEVLAERYVLRCTNYDTEPATLRSVKKRLTDIEKDGLCRDEHVIVKVTS